MSTVSTYIPLNVLEILMSCVNSVNIYTIECIRNPYVLCQQCQHIWYLMVWLENPDSQHYKTKFWIKNWLNIKEVMSTNVCVICIKSINSVSIYGI